MKKPAGSEPAGLNGPKTVRAYVMRGTCNCQTSMATDLASSPSISISATWSSSTVRLGAGFPDRLIALLPTVHRIAQILRDARRQKLVGLFPLFTIS